MLTVAVLVITLLTLTGVIGLYSSKPQPPIPFIDDELEVDQDWLHDDYKDWEQPKNPRRVAAGKGIAAKAVRDSHGRFTTKA